MFQTISWHKSIETASVLYTEHTLLHVFRRIFAFFEAKKA